MVQITAKTIARVERDLRRYPDWIVRLQARGLGLPPGSPLNSGVGGGSSSVEAAYSIDTEIQRKVFVIENVYDRLNPTAKKLVDQRYFRDYPQKQVADDLGLNNRSYYRYRDMAIESFARGFGYID
ncbi:MAG: hypothetical protein QM401_04380 [Bacillota bacterium]|nr:hypothetical protein [Bacillota bacterium]